MFCDRLDDTPSPEIFTSSSQILEYVAVHVNADFAMVIKLRILREGFLVYPSVLGVLTGVLSCKREVGGSEGK